MMSFETICNELLAKLAVIGKEGAPFQAGIGWKSWVQDGLLARLER